MHKKNKINIVTLGCSKNLVDSEYLMKQLEVGGWSVVYDSNDPTAKVVVVNTCGFVADAKEESVNTILSFVSAKKAGIVEKLYVMGCLSQRYKDDLVAEIPEVDGFFGVNDLKDILKNLNTKFSENNINKRLITTPSHYAYLKISEGCSWGCSFCAIPLIRGKHISKPIPEVVDEAKWLVSQGIKEIILIAQDSTFYGKDIYSTRKIAELVEHIADIKGVEWVRVHYAYPAGFPMDLLNVMSKNLRVCNYLDIPFQHISDKMLKIMRRGISKQDTIELIKKIRNEVPDIALRTTLLVGHPGEEEEDFLELESFVKDIKFDRLGVFAYSEEENTHSASLKNNVPEMLKHERVERIMQIQRDISFQNNLQRVGETFKVIIDREEDEYLIGRTEYDSPEVDQEVLISKHQANTVHPSSFVNCKIVRADDYDLYGEIVT